MMPDRTLRDAIRRVVSLYDHSIICPAVLWDGVVRVMTPASAAGILDSLPADTPRRLGEVFEQRPSLPQDSESAAVVAALVAWLRRDRARS